MDTSSRRYTRPPAIRIIRFKYLPYGGPNKRVKFDVKPLKSQDIVVEFSVFVYIFIFPSIYMYTIICVCIPSYFVRSRSLYQHEQHDQSSRTSSFASRVSTCSLESKTPPAAIILHRSREHVRLWTPTSPFSFSELSDLQVVRFQSRPVVHSARSSRAVRRYRDTYLRVECQEIIDKDLHEDLSMEEDA